MIRLPSMAGGLLLLTVLLLPVQLSAQHAIPLERLRQNVKQVWSRSKEFVADSNFDTKVTRFSRVEWQGNMGRSTPVWSMEGAFPIAWLANDGEHFVTAYEGGHLLPQGYDRNQVMLSFTRRGKVINQIGLSQLINDFSRLERVGSNYRWFRYWGLNTCGYLVLETVEQKELLFDVTTGRPAKLESEKASGGPGWKNHRNLLMCYEFQYPPDYLLKQDRIFDGSPSAQILLKRAQDKEWLIDVSIEDMTTYPREYARKSFADFVLDRASGMYSADGHGSSVYASGAVRERRYKNRDNLEVMEFYLNIVHETFLESGKSARMKTTAGPIYAVSVGGPSEPYRVLFLRPADRDDSSLQAQDILKQTAESVRRRLTAP